MNKRQTRLAQIVDILLHNNVGSQEELLEHLLRRNFKVTQATLSRDLKTLRTSKVATEMGGYRYIITSGGAAMGKNDEADFTMPVNDFGGTDKILSVARTGSLVVVKTRNGYAPGVAYDIDTMDNPHLIGTIAGSDTLFIAINQNSSLRDVFLALSIIIPSDVLNECRDQFFN